MMSSRILTGMWFLGLAVHAHPVLAEEPSPPERPLKRRNNSTVHLGFDLGASQLSGLQRVQGGGEEALPGGAGFSMTAMEVGILLRPNVHLLLQVGDALYDESAQGVYEEYWLDSTSMLFYDVGVAWFPWENRGLYGEALVGLGIVESGAITILGEEGEELRDTGMNLGLGLGQQWPLRRRLHLNLEVSGHHHQGSDTSVNALLFQGGLHWYL